MRNLVLLLAAFFITASLSGQSFSTSPRGLNTESFSPSASSVLFQKSEQTRLSMQYEGEHAIDKCGAYRKMKIAGIVLSAVGGAMILTGSIIRGMAYRASNDGTITDYDYNGAMAGGGAMIGLGALSLGAGIPLAIIGSVKTRHYCNGSRPAY